MDPAFIGDYYGLAGWSGYQHVGLQSGMGTLGGGRIARSVLLVQSDEHGRSAEVETIWEGVEAERRGLRRHAGTNLVSTAYAEEAADGSVSPAVLRLQQDAEQDLLTWQPRRLNVEGQAVTVDFFTLRDGRFWTAIGQFRARHIVLRCCDIPIEEVEIVNLREPAT